MPQTYLVTGGAGFIGSNICDVLAGQGHLEQLLDLGVLDLAAGDALVADRQG